VNVWRDHHHRLWPVQPTHNSPLDTKPPTLKPSAHPRTFGRAADFETNSFTVTTYVINATEGPRFRSGPQSFKKPESPSR
jgi:hypothetical protein